VNCVGLSTRRTVTKVTIVAFPARTAQPWPRILPLTSVERRGWMHRVHVASGEGWVITEQIHTVSADRFRRYAPEITLSAGELDEVRHMLAQMLIVSTISSERPASQ